MPATPLRLARTAFFSESTHAPSEGQLLLFAPFMLRHPRTWSQSFRESSPILHNVFCVSTGHFRLLYDNLLPSSLASASPSRRIPQTLHSSARASLRRPTTSSHHARHIHTSPSVLPSCIWTAIESFRILEPTPVLESLYIPSCLLAIPMEVGVDLMKPISSRPMDVILRPQRPEGSL